MLSSHSQTYLAKLLPRVVISSPQGRSGKTIVAIGLCAAFRQRGLLVQPFKKGPDYIDPSWLSAIASRSCRNLDVFLMPEEVLLSSFQRACGDVDLVLIEGAMGLYDGFEPNGEGSTAHLARLIHSPVLLVVNAARMTRSIAAMVMGYQHFEPETHIAGVILNNVSGSRHETKLKAAIEQHCGLPIVGSIPRDSSMHIMERHLGLMPYPEAEESAFIIDRIGHRLKNYLDSDNVLAIAKSAKTVLMADTTISTPKTPVVKVGVMRDRVFNFYYPENLEALQQAGAELVFINSLQDQKLPDIDGLYIGGGFPEFFLAELETNSGLRQDIAHAVENGLPVYAECAGLMYLCRNIHWHSQQYEMVGTIPAEVEICQRPQGHGYVIVKINEDNPLFPSGLTLRGHEFHHSKLHLNGNVKFGYRIQRGYGIDGKVDGIIYKNVFAAYTHLHALGSFYWAESFISLALRQCKLQRSFSDLKA